MTPGDGRDRIAGLEGRGGRPLAARVLQVRLVLGIQGQEVLAHLGRGGLRGRGADPEGLGTS